MGKSTTIERFFKKINSVSTPETSVSMPNLENPAVEQDQTPIPDPEQVQPPSKIRRIDTQEVDISHLERDPGIRRQIWEYPINQQDEIRRAYLKAGPYRFSPPHCSDFPLSGAKGRRFKASWYNMFDWLEYSPSNDGAYCLSCYLFSQRPVGRHGGATAFIVEGFRSWKKVNAGSNCAFLGHIGRDPCSFHNNAVKYSNTLMKQSQHIDKVMEKQSSEQIICNRLRLKASIDCVRYLVSQACAFRGHDESLDSRNQGNFLELLKLLCTYNDKVSEVVLENAPKNAKYTSHHIQKEILQVLARRVKSSIREEVGDSKFCIIVDEARDESKREQMALILRFVDSHGFVKERFFDVIHVKDTSALTLKKEILVVVACHNLNVQNIRGQGYDGASNMRGEWNGLQALILNECPYAYYVHCMAHRLQLVLVASSKAVIPVHQFFTKLTSIINIVGASCKRNDELHAAQAEEIRKLIDIDELETGKGANQIGTLKRAGDTRWSSHFLSVTSLVKLFGPTLKVLLNIISDGSTSSQRGDADAAYGVMMSMEFVFILLLMREVLGSTNDLCIALQLQTQDIPNAIHLVRTTKVILQKLREVG